MWGSPGVCGVSVPGVAHVRQVEREAHLRVPACRSPLCPTATGVFYVLSGQHKFRASQLIREAAVLANREPPPFTLNFRCSVLKEGFTLDQLQRVAGRLQSRAQAVRKMTYAETMESLVEEARAMREADPAKQWPNRTDLLKAVYTKTAKSELVDGAEVRPSP